MSFFGSYFGGGSGGSSSVVYTPANIANAATAETIRDRIYTLIEALTPVSLTADKFVRYRNEGGADFDGWAEKVPASALRRFQVRQVGGIPFPETTGTDFETVVVTLEIRVAYPQTSRYGAANGMDRDDIISQDLQRIDMAVGALGRANFSGTNDCTPMPTEDDRERSGKVDYLVLRGFYQFRRSTT